ncbi:4-hydroxybenzoate polyprenyltransferase [Rhodospirillum rubrum]|uniref:4-hydroxybenzoate octaprenyltransferase n=1 Tax=Rhodospirillum rubrum TaxID=1085 RepID=UPI00190904DA|nr:4-hydroxybenzoate octaprenyltransferase [Rhodospirillum rubrum]MBK1664258.1 4-hydroxybenzoate polyprenyltransferase [Rhodospirillum rubrum]MBK1675324.1 4-hydroxybenzoate polyprenyltransferase [Rhodospirillum rubrum]
MGASDTLIGDMPRDGWVDRMAPGVIRPYLKLMRLDRPIGTWLLLFPCWWSQSMAAQGWPDLWLAALFAAGALVMRGAGCTFNDIVDRDFDAQVARTAARPIPSGAVSRKKAVVFLGAQLLVGLAVLLSLNGFSIWLGVASLILVFGYPFMKRITYWPQAWLGLTFTYGALMGWAAVRGSLDPAPLLLYAACFFWTLHYDTIYAHQDKEDDLLVGVKSSALALGARTRPALVVFSTLMMALVAAAGWQAGLSWPFWALLGLPAAHLAWQIWRVDIHDSPVCLMIFKSNRFVGWLLLAAIVAGRAPGGV